MFASITFAPAESESLGPSPVGFFSSSVPVWAAFPHPLTRVRIPAASDYYAPSDSPRGPWDFVRVAPYLLSTSLLIPMGVSRVHRRGLKQNAVGGVFLQAPSTLCGSPIRTQGRSG